jgi:tRNA-dihydrouridine synthase C
LDNCDGNNDITLLISSKTVYDRGRMISIEHQRPAVILAPMEGVTDWPVRVLLTRRPGFSHCVSEFIRISQALLPDRVFLKAVPELSQGGRTPTGVPVQVQLMGGDPQKMAESARQVAHLGALGIDINFGCPSPIVNRREAGAALLKHPQKIYELVSRVREATPPHIPVSAKLRLGWDTTDAIFENSKLVEKAGASWITVHARTKVQGYAAPVHWDLLKEVRERLKIPVIVNGDISTLNDYQQCKQTTGAIHFMIGRGALADPTLAESIKADLENKAPQSPQNSEQAQVEWKSLFKELSELTEPLALCPDYSVRRIKQWVNLACRRKQFPFFEALKKTKNLQEIFQVLEGVS